MNSWTDGDLYGYLSLRSKQNSANATHEKTIAELGNTPHRDRTRSEVSMVICIKNLHRKKQI